MKTVRLFDFLAYDGDSFQVVAQDGARLALKSLTTNRVRHVGVAELLGDDSFEPDAPNRLPVLDDVAVLETLDDETRQATIRLYRHIYEIVHGTPPLALFDDEEFVPNPAYDPVRPISERISAKAEELATSDRPLSARTLRGQVSDYRKRGVSALVDGRKRRELQPGRDQDPRLLALIREEVAAQENISTGTRSRVSTVVGIKARELGVAVPSKSTMDRLVRAEEPSTQPFGDATLRRTQANRPARSYGRRTPLRPGELVEIDSTKLDIMVVFPDGSTGRPELTTMIDVATTTVGASVLFAESTKGIDVAALVLARSLTPLLMQPGWSEELALARSVLPAAMIEPDETLRPLVAARPLIYPETITIDRGRVYTGSVFQSACSQLQISIIPAPPGTPTAKPHVERQFRAVHEGLIQYLVGYVGRNVVRRGKDPSQEAFWTLSQLQGILDQWLVQHWQTTPRKRLSVPAMPKKALSPNEMYAALSGIAPTPAVALTRDDYISLLPVDFRTIQPYGINHSNLVYDSPELHPYRGQKSGLGGRSPDKWEVRYDPARMNTLFIRDHHKSRWIEADWHLSKSTLGPFSLAVLEAALRAVSKRDATTPQHEVVKDIVRIQSSLNLTGTERSAARRRNTSVTDLTLVTDTTSDEAVDSEPAQQPREKPLQRKLPERLI